MSDGDRLRELEPSAGYSDTVSGIAAGTFWITLDGTPYFGGLIDLEGAHTLEASVTDEAGNSASASVSFTIDRTSPVVTITSPADGGKYNSAQTFAFTIDDECEDVLVLSDPYLGYVWTTEGLFAATASATDAAGNSGSDSVSFMIDTTAPGTAADLDGSLTASGWFVSPVTVSLNASDSLSGGVASGVASTWISVDGSGFEPYVYDSPVTVSGEGGHVVSFYSIDQAGNVESAGTESFMIDTVDPTVAIALDGTDGDAGWFVSDVTATITGLDETSGIDYLEYDIDGHGWVEYSGALTLTDGIHTLRARSVDVAGNVSDVAEETFSVDTVAPSVGISWDGTAGSPGWYVSSVTAQLAGSDATSGLDRIEYDLGAGWVEYTGALTLTDGIHTLRARSVDVAGNVSDVAEETFSVDTVAPVTMCTPDRPPGFGGWYTDAMVLTLAAIDSGSGVSQTFYSFDGVEWDAYTTPLLIDDPGTTSVWYFSTDAAGNAETVADEYSVSLDLDDPEPLFSGVSAGDWVYEATIDFCATDPTPGSGIDSVTATLDGEPFEPGTVDAEGTHTLVVTATDNAGRTAQTSVRFTIDRTAPAITINNPADGGMYNTAQTFDFTVDDADPMVDVTSDPAFGHTWTGEGAYRASVASEDRAGNSSAAAIDFMIDMTAPQTEARVVSGTLGENGWWTSAVTIDIAAIDPESAGVASGVDTTWYRLNGDAWVEGDTLDVAAEGVHALEFYSVDHAGNVEATGSFEFDIDTSPPSAEIVLTGTPGTVLSGWFVSDVTVTTIVTDAVSGPAGWQYRLDDADPWTMYTGSLVLPHGVWDLQVRPLDFAGNIGPVVTETVRVDTVAPETACAPDRLPDHGGWYTDSVTLTLSATESGSGVSKTYYSFDGASWAEYTAPLTVSTAGPTSLWYYSTDVAGNVEGISSCSVNLDLADPMPFFSGVSAGDWVYEATIDFDATDPTPGSGIDSVAATLNGVAIPDGYIASTEGENTLVVTATDNAGRTAQTSVSFTIDRTAPAITINNPVDGGMYDTAQTFDFTVDDADPMVDVTSDPALGHTWTGEGAYSASVRARDRAGNDSSAAVAFMIDMTAPVSSAAVTAGDPGTNGWWKSAATVTITSNDPKSGGVASDVETTWYRLNDGPWTEGTSLQISTEGVHEVAYHSVDKAGNAEEPRSLQVKVDLYAPVVTVASPTAGTYLYGASTTARFSASDGCSGLVPGAPTATCNGEVVTNGQMLTLTNAGANTFVARATDQAGHETVVTVPFTVAFDPGEILPPGSLDHTWNAGRMMPIKFTVLDATGKPTAAAIAIVDVKLVSASGRITQVAAGTAVVSNDKGACFYHFNAKTIKGQAGTLKVKITLNDGVTVMEKDIYLR